MSAAAQEEPRIPSRSPNKNGRGPSNWAILCFSRHMNWKLFGKLSRWDSTQHTDGILAFQTAASLATPKHQLLMHLIFVFFHELSSIADKREPWIEFKSL